MVAFVHMLDIFSLESLLAAQGVTGLLARFDEVLATLPGNSPERKILRLLHKAILLDASFLTDHPEALLQCLWNRGWWYDSPDAAAFVRPPREGWRDGIPPWDQPGPRLFHLLERWRAVKEQFDPEWRWLRSLWPPERSLDSPVLAEINADEMLYPVSFGADHSQVYLSTQRYVEIDELAHLLPPGRRVKTQELTSLWTLSKTSLTNLTKERLPLQRLSPSGDKFLQWDSWQDPFTMCEKATGDVIATFDVIEDFSIQDAFFALDGQYIIAYGWFDDYYGMSYVWRVLPDESGQTARVNVELICAVETVSQPSCATLSKTAKHLYLGIGGRLVKVDVATRQVQRTLHISTNSSLQGLLLSDDESCIACSDGNRVLLWSLTDGEDSMLCFNDDTIGMVAFSPNGARLYTRPWLWDGHTGQLVSRLEDNVGNYLEGGPPANARYLGNERLISVEGSVTFWDTATGEEQLTGRNQGGMCISNRYIVALSPSQALIAYLEGGEDELFLYDLENEESTQLTREGSKVVAFSPDGSRLAAGDERGHIAVLNVATKTWELEFQMHPSETTGLLFSPHAPVIASGGLNDCVRIWHIETGEELATLPFEALHDGVFTRWQNGEESIGWTPKPQDILRLETITSWMPQTRQWQARFSSQSILTVTSTSDPLLQFSAPVPQNPSLCPHPHLPRWAGAMFYLVLETSNASEPQ